MDRVRYLKDKHAFDKLTTFVFLGELSETDARLVMHILQNSDLSPMKALDKLRSKDLDMIELRVIETPWQRT